MPRDVAEPLQTVADPVAVELEAALALRRSGADAKALRRALRRMVAERRPIAAAQPL